MILALHYTITSLKWLTNQFSLVFFLSFRWQTCSKDTKHELHSEEREGQTTYRMVEAFSVHFDAVNIAVFNKRKGILPLPIRILFSH